MKLTLNLVIALTARPTLDSSACWDCYMGLYILSHCDYVDCCTHWGSVFGLEVKLFHFWCGPFLMFLLNLLQYYFYFMFLGFFFFWLQVMWELSFLISDWTHISCIWRRSFSPWTDREVPRNKIFNSYVPAQYFIDYPPANTHTPCIHHLCVYLPNTLLPTSHPVSLPIHDISAQILSFWRNISRHTSPKRFLILKSHSTYGLCQVIKNSCGTLWFCETFHSLPFQISCCYCLVPNWRFSLL